MTQERDRIFAGVWRWCRLGDEDPDAHDYHTKRLRGLVGCAEARRTVDVHKSKSDMTHLERALMQTCGGWRLRRQESVVGLDWQVAYSVRNLPAVKGLDPVDRAERIACVLGTIEDIEDGADLEPLAEWGRLDPSLLPQTARGLRRE